MARKKTAAVPATPEAPETPEVDVEANVNGGGTEVSAAAEPEPETEPETEASDPALTLEPTRPEEGAIYSRGFLAGGREVPAGTELGEIAGGVCKAKEDGPLTDGELSSAWLANRVGSKKTG